MDNVEQIRSEGDVGIGELPLKRFLIITKTRFMGDTFVITRYTHIDVYFLVIDGLLDTNSEIRGSIGTASNIVSLSHRVGKIGHLFFLCGEALAYAKLPIHYTTGGKMQIPQMPTANKPSPNPV